MSYYDPINRVLRGRRVPQIYNEKCSVGQVALNVLSDNSSKVLQINDDDGIELTSTEISKMMVNIAKNLHKLGMRSGDIAGLCVTNTTYVAPLVLGCLLLRLPINPADKYFDVGQIVNIYRRTDPKIIFCDHDCVDKIISVLEVTRSDAVVVTITDRVVGFINILDLMVDCDIEDDDFIYETTTSTIPAFIACTSGSTGDPKLALISHLQLMQLYSWFDDLVEIKLSYCPAALFWLTGFSHIIFRTLNAQKRVITAKPFSPDLFFDLIERHRINDAFLFTPHLKLILESPRFETADLSHLEMITSGGFSTPKSFCQLFLQKMPKGIFIVGYGVSECGGISLKVVNEDSTSSVGVPCPNTEVKIQLDDGTPSFIREIGEVLVRHPTRFFGYFNNYPVAKIDDEGWFHTGDMGYIDENHELNIVGQRTQAIKNIHCEIYPFEIESRIETIFGIKQVVVVGTPDPIELYVPTALVVKAVDSQIDMDDIIEVLSDLPQYKRLTGGIFFVDKLPLTTNGKIQRSEAKEMATKLKIERNASDEWL